METLVIAAFVIATLSLAMTFMIVPVLAYLTWRYVYVPWAVMRRDVTALNAQMGELEQQARVRVMNDAEVARVEARVNARQRARMGVE